MTWHNKKNFVHLHFSPEKDVGASQPLFLGRGWVPFVLVSRLRLWCWEKGVNIESPPRMTARDFTGRISCDTISVRTCLYFDVSLHILFLEVRGYQTDSGVLGTNNVSGTDFWYASPPEKKVRSLGPPSGRLKAT